MTDRSNRGPLWAVVLAQTGEDVRHCGQCFTCDDYREPDMDLTFGEIFRAAAHDQAIALSSQTLWTCDRLLHNGIHCQNGLDIAAIVAALRQEAHLRGLAH